MKNCGFRQLVVLMFCLSSIYTPFLQAGQLSLPSGDLIAPKVTHEPITNLLKPGSSVAIKARVTDNVGVETVTLFYRVSGTKDYQRAKMSRIANTDMFSVTLGKEKLAKPGLDYYIQAMDLAGNSLLHGYSFSPLSLSVGESEMLAEVPIDVKGDKGSGTAGAEAKSKNWWWIALGVVAAGAAIAAASDDGDDSSKGGGDSGTVVISGPSP